MSLRSSFGAGTPRRRELDDPIARECDEDEHANDTGT